MAWCKWSTVSVVTILLTLMACCLAVVPQQPHFKNGEHNADFHEETPDKTPKDLINELINGNDVVVFSKSYCPYSTRAKQLLERENIHAEVLELDHHPLGSEIQKTLFEMTGQRTVPNIFINGHHVGGSDDLHALHARGDLAKTLANQ